MPDKDSEESKANKEGDNKKPKVERVDDEEEEKKKKKTRNLRRVGPKRRSLIR